MKRFLSILLILFTLFGIGSANAANPSSSILSQYWSNPAMPFEVIGNTKNWPSLYQVLDDKYNLVDLIGEEYQLDEALLITVDAAYRRVTWHFPSSYVGVKRISVLFVRKDMSYANIMSARGQKDGTIQMNFIVLEQGEYYMLVYSVR